MGSQTSSQATATNEQVFRPLDTKVKNVVIPVDASRQAEAAFLCNEAFSTNSAIIAPFSAELSWQYSTGAVFKKGIKLNLS